MPEPTDVPPPPKRVGRWEDFIDIFYAPASVFRRRQKESALIPMLVVAAVAGTLAFVTFDQTAPALQRATARVMTELTAGHPELQGMQNPTKLTGIQGAIMKLSAALQPLFGMVLGGFVAWIIGSLLRSRQTFKAAFVVVAYAWIPRALKSLIIAIQLLISGKPATTTAELSLGPARFLDADKTDLMLLTLADRCDLAILWSLVLLWIGYVNTSQLSRGRAAIAVLIVWLLPLAYSLITLAIM